MKDKLLFGTIGLLVGIVAMQWTMPSSKAEVVSSPVGNIVAIVGNTVVVGADGGYWVFNTSSRTWRLVDQLPLPLTDIAFIESTGGFVDKAGNLWEHESDVHWVNCGQPPIGPVEANQATWGKVKATFSGKGDKQ